MPFLPLIAQDAMTKPGAIAEAERRCRALGKGYKITRLAHTRDYILRPDTLEIPAGHVLVAHVHSDGVVQEIRPE